MKTSEQMVAQTGGPYRSLDLEGRRRRTQLVREIDFLESVRKWQGRASGQNFPWLFIPLAIGIAVGIVSGNSVWLQTLAVGVSILWCWRYTVLLVILRCPDDPVPLIRQKLDELANLPPE